MNVEKANGEIVAFDADKIRRALIRVNVKPTLVEKVINAVGEKIYDEIPTSELFRIVFKQLKELQGNKAGKYNLKRAIMALGPSGYPFEEFMAALWRVDGFTAETGKIVSGHCVSHEVDVVARRGELRDFVECKHHSFHGNICSVRNTLYFYARFLDIKKKAKAESGKTIKTYKGWLVTNTRFSSDAIKYGTCVGLGLLSWDFPPNDGLRERIDKAGIHPITCLTTLSVKQKEKLMNKKITLCMDLCDQPSKLLDIGIRGANAKRILEEASAICGMP